jgi:hypothetical protein
MGVAYGATAPASTHLLRRRRHVRTSISCYAPPDRCIAAGMLAGLVMPC